MPVKVFWVPGRWQGRLGILPRPRGGDWLGDEMTAWREAGIDVVVSLLEPEEEVQLVLEGEAAAASTSGIEFRAFPTPDRGVPASYESVAALTTGIVESLERGRNVAVHCRQGIGRSAVIVGAVLVTAGDTPTTAILTITASRGLPVPETTEQQRWIGEFSAWLHAAPAAQQPLQPTASDGG
jgi:protein-tyrosine phosphatase